MNSPNINAFICTRNENYPLDLVRLKIYLNKANINLHVLENKSSIFSAYEEKFNELSPNLKDNDIIILCHDDIEILTDSDIFKILLIRELKDDKVGFVGVAGTSLLGVDAVWWEHNRWKEGHHRGCVFHGSNIYEQHVSWYGLPGNVVCLDGLFLAATVKTLKKVGLAKPKTFEGEWDFYDLYYTTRAYEMGYTNKVAPILVRHGSPGVLVGRDSWHKNRSKFMSMFRLPIQCG